MDSYQKIEQLQQQIEQLEARLVRIRKRYQQTQDPVLRQAMQEEISGLIDAIDQARSQLELEQARLPQKRTNGHHPPESEEDLELLIDPNVSEKGDKPSEN